MQHSARQSRPPSPVPATAPQTERIKLSVSICRMSRPRPAPRAERIATSVRLPAPRARSRFDKFVQPMRSTPPTAHSRIRRPRQTPRQVLTQARKSCAESPSLWIRAPEALIDDLEFSLSLLYRYLGLKTTDHSEGIPPPIGCLRKRKRHQHVHARARFKHS